MSVLLIVSESAGVGKSAVALALAKLSNRSGRAAQAFRPLSFDGDDDDAAIFERLAGTGLAGWPRSTAQGGPTDDDLAALGSALADYTDGDSLAVIELPSAIGRDSLAHAAEALDARVVVVVGASRQLRGGDLSTWTNSFGDRLIGVLINGVSRYLGAETAEDIAPSFQAAGIDLIGTIPEDRLLLSLTVEQVRAGLGGRYVVEEGDIDGPIEWFQVGALSLDSGELRFSLYDNNAAVVRGDRPDLQMSALNASVSCLVLTGGTEPIEYISYEAREEETPVIVVEPDTLTTMSLLNDVTSSARMDTAMKVSRFSELLEAHADLAMVWEAL